MGAGNLSRLPEAEGAFFFKQWCGVQKHRTGRELGGRTFDEMPKAA
jgi:protein gp37